MAFLKDLLILLEKVFHCLVLPSCTSCCPAVLVSPSLLCSRMLFPLRGPHCSDSNPSLHCPFNTPAEHPSLCVSPKAIDTCVWEAACHPTRLWETVLSIFVLLARLLACIGDTNVYLNEGFSVSFPISKEVFSEERLFLSFLLDSIRQGFPYFILFWKALLYVCFCSCFAQPCCAWKPSHCLRWDLQRLLSGSTLFFWKYLPDVWITCEPRALGGIPVQ